MKKHLIALNIAILTLLIAPIIIQQVNATTANAYPYHPQCRVYGKVTKDWYVGRKWQEYRDDQGLSSFLPFNRTNENITINFANIVFDRNFENKSISAATETGSTSYLTVSKDVLMENGQEYIYIKAINKTALTTSSTYIITEELSVEEKEVTNDYYILSTLWLKPLGSNLQAVEAVIYYIFKDSGLTERMILVRITDKSGADQVTSTDTTVTIKRWGFKETWVTIQMKLQDLLDAAGKTWNLAKLTGVKYEVVLYTGSTLDSSMGVEAKIKHAIINPSRIYIDDPAYTNGLIVNGTQGYLTASAGDIINVYGVNATKIVGVTIPFVYEDDRDFDQICTAIAECYGFQYEWKFILPKSPTTGDKLTYSDTNITLRCWFDGSYVDRLYVNGVDKTTQVSGKKVDTSEGIQDKDRAWTYLVASSLTAGNQYDVELKVKNLPKDVWYSLTSEPVSLLTWQWWYDKLLLILAFISNLLGGIGSSWIKAQREKLRVPKR